METFAIDAEPRNDVGKGASRRLRHAGKLPAILYGGDEEPMNLTLDHNKMIRHLEHEAFYSHILTLNLGKKKQKVVLKDLQRHPVKPQIMHIDLQRVDDKKKLHMHVPLHFINEYSSPTRKMGGVISHLVVEVEVGCLPKDLPEFIEVDLAELELGQTMLLSEITLPKGVELMALVHDHDQPVVTATKAHTEVEEKEEGEEGEGAAEGEE